MSKLLTAIIITIFSITANAIDSELYKEVKKLRFIKKSSNPGDLSGVTYSKVSNTYFYILNKKGLIFESDENFIQRGETIKIKDCGDTEEIVYLGTKEIAGINYPQVAMANEAGEIFIFTITNRRKYTRQDMLVFNINKNRQNWRNVGIEGLAYDSENGIFYAAKEKRPMAIFKFKRPYDVDEARSLDIELIADNERLSYLTEWASKVGKIKDLSGLYFNSVTKRLLVLSDENRIIIDINLNNLHDKNSILLPKKVGTKKKKSSQFEGITMNSNGEIIVVSEPYHIVKFKNFDILKK